MSVVGEALPYRVALRMTAAEGGSDLGGAST